jgi:Uncharacterized protein conserved in bacteria (DUF2242)
MECRPSAVAVLRCLALLTAATALAGCASRKQDIAEESLSATAPFSKTFAGSGDTVCWSVKRALLSQGYMLDRPTDSGVLTGTREFQPKPKLNVAIHLQTTCADNRNGTSIVFVTASREESRLQKMKQSTSVGVGPATLTMPSGSAEVLGVVSRETIQDPDFYNRFFGLIQGYVAQEQANGASLHADQRQPQRSPSSNP